VVVTLLVFRILARNLDDDHVLLPLRFGYAGQLLFVVLFVLSGREPRFQRAGNRDSGHHGVRRVRFLGKAVAILRLGAFRPGAPGRRAAVSVAASDVGSRW